MYNPCSPGKGKAGANWYHLTHCVPAQPPSRTLAEVRTNLAETGDRQPTETRKPLHVLVSINSVLSSYSTFL